MNINPDKVKELVLLFSKLDDEYQDELINQAYLLSIKQTQKDELKKEKKINKGKEEYFKKEIEERSNKRLEGIYNIVEKFSKMDNKEKAEFVVLLDKLSSGGMTKKTNIEIKINEEKVSLKEYLEEILPETDFCEANKNVERYLKELKK